MTYPALDRPQVRSLFVGWTIPCLLLCVACGDSSSASPGPPLVEGERLGTGGAHEHGIARLGLAVDGTLLTVDLELPAESVFGFERAPRSAEERATVAEALDRLRTGGGRLIAFPDGATCTLDSAEVHAPEGVEGDPAGEDQQPDEDEAHDHDEDEAHDHDEDEAHDHDEDEAHDHDEDEAHDHDEDEAHDHDEDEAHDHDEDEAHDHDEDEDHDHAEDEGNGHAEVHLLASLTCSREPLGPASLRFADLLPDVEQVDLTVFTAAGEAAGRVAPDASFRF